MSGSEPVAVVRQGWDGPSYRVRTEAFEAWFVVGVGEDLEPSPMSMLMWRVLQRHGYQC